MSWVIARDYGGMFGLERLGPVFRDWVRLWYLGGEGFTGTILEEFRELFSFYAGTRTKGKSGVLYICVIFQTSNEKGFSNNLLLCYV